MLITTVELWPGGWPHHARVIGRLAIANVAGNPEVADYIGAAVDDTGTSSSLWMPRHRRSDGFWPLLARAADACDTSTPANSPPSAYEGAASALLARLTSTTFPRRPIEAEDHPE